MPNIVTMTIANDNSNAIYRVYTHTNDNDNTNAIARANANAKASTADSKLVFRYEITDEEHIAISQQAW
jgi:hypothetical protein